MRLAAAIALESRGALTVTAVDLSAAPDLLNQYPITTVPYFVLDGRHGFAGPLPELMLLQRIADLKASTS